MFARTGRTRYPCTMQKSISTVLDTDKQRLAHNSILAVAGTLLSRASGVIRTLVVNATFGANTTLDAFNAAFRFPNGLRDLFADGALSAAFVKVLVDMSGNGEGAIRELIAITSGFFLFVTVLLAVIAAIFAKPFIALIGGQAFIARRLACTATLPNSSRMFTSNARIISTS